MLYKRIKEKPIIQQHRINTSKSKECSQSDKETSYQHQKRNKIPVPIPQIKINSSRKQLLSVPIIKGCQTIKQLYISHNKIKSAAQLSSYSSLVNLNIANNQLDNIYQFITELASLKHLKRLNVRNNLFGYGYQDKIVLALINNLQQLDDQALGTVDQKRKIYMLAQQVSGMVLPILWMIEAKLNGICNNQKRLQQGGVKKDLEAVATLSKFYKSKKRVYLPMDRMTQLDKIYQILIIFSHFQLRSTQTMFDPIKENTIMFEKLLVQLLSKFTLRNNHHLLRTLTKHSGCPSAQSIDTSLLIEEFAKQYHAYSLSIKDSEHPGKFIQKVDPQEVKKHPMFDYLENKENSKDLNIQRRINHKKLEYKQNTAVKSSPIFSRFPIIIYQRNYLEIIYEILFENIRVMIRAFDQANLQTIKTKRVLSNSHHKISHIQFGIPEESHSVENQASEENEGLKMIPIPQTSKQEKQRQNENTKMSTLATNTQIIPRWTLNRIEEIKQQKWCKNLSKYSLYEINLAYKVLRVLNHHRKKKKAKHGF